MDFLPQNDQIWPKIGIFGQFGPGHAGFFGALLVGRLVVVARGLYLARHLFTLSYNLFCFRNIARIANANASAVLLMKCHNKLLKKLIWETLSKDGVSAICC